MKREKKRNVLRLAIPNPKGNPLWRELMERRSQALPDKRRETERRACRKPVRPNND